MATKERAGGRLLRFPRRDTVNLSRRAFMGMAEAGGGFLLGAVLSGAEIFGLYSPFGVALVGAAGSGLCGGAARPGRGSAGFAPWPGPAWGTSVWRG